MGRMPSRQSPVQGVEYVERQENIKNTRRHPKPPQYSSCRHLVGRCGRYHHRRRNAGRASPTAGTVFGARWAQTQHHPDCGRRLWLRRLRSLRRRRRSRYADAQSRSHIERGHDILRFLRPAKLYARPRCDHDRTHSEPQRHDNRGIPGPGRRAAEGGMDSGFGPQDRRLQDLLHGQVAPRRSRLRAAKRSGLRRNEILRALSPECLHLCRPDLVSRHVG
jgi:hypothetical protein